MHRICASLLAIAIVASACGTSLEDAAPSVGTAPEADDGSVSWDDVRALQEPGAIPPSTTPTTAGEVSIDIEFVSAEPVDAPEAELAFTDFEAFGYVGPVVVYGRPDLVDPFAEGDVQLIAVFDPHVDDDHVVDGSTGDSIETEIAGRTAQIIPWRSSDDITVGHTILWDADPDHYVLARSRSLELTDLVDLVAGVSIRDGQVGFDHADRGLVPMAVEPTLLLEPALQLRHLPGTAWAHRLLADDGRHADLVVRLVDGSAADVLGWRFLAGAEQSVVVRGQDGFLLEGLGASIDDVESAVVWTEPDGRLGFAGIDEIGFEHELVSIVDQLVLGD